MAPPVKKKKPDEKVISIDKDLFVDIPIKKKQKLSKRVRFRDKEISENQIKGNQKGSPKIINHRGEYQMEIAAKKVKNQKNNSMIVDQSTKIE